MSEPTILSRGKIFHKYVQEDWMQSADGTINIEETLPNSDLPNHVSRRIDILIETSDGLLVIVEIKASNWDIMSQSSVKRNVNRYSKKLWAHIEKVLGEEPVQGLMIFPKGKNRDRRKLVEQLFEERGITVLWVP